MCSNLRVQLYMLNYIKIVENLCYWISIVEIRIVSGSTKYALHEQMQPLMHQFAYIIILHPMINIDFGTLKLDVKKSSLKIGVELESHPPIAK